MRLRSKMVVYLVLLHLVFGALFVFLLRTRPIWLVIVLQLLALSILIGFLRVRDLFRPLDLMAYGAEQIRGHDFTSRLLHVGQPEMDDLISSYNSMIDQLRNERVRVRESNHFLDLLMAASPAGIVICDYAGEIELVNTSAEEVLGLSSEELVGQSFDTVASSVADVSATLQPGQSEVVSLSAGRQVRVHRVDLRSQGFPRTSYLLEELTEELRRSERSVYETLIRTLSHEVNNSVAVVGSLLHSMAHYAGQLGEEERQDFSSAIGLSTSRLDHLRAFTAGFADLVRLPPPEPRPCDVGLLIEEIARLMTPSLAEQGIACDWRILGKPGLISLDKNQIEQVLVNVIKNASEAIDADGWIALTLEHSNDAASLEIEDSAGSLKPEVEAKLFSPFFTTKENGRGLGLTVVHEILSRHHFDFSLRRTDTGTTRFRIDFPTETLAASAPQITSRARRAGTEAGSPRLSPLT